LLLANGPDTIILMVNRRVQVKVFFIGKKDLLREFHWQATDKFHNYSGVTKKIPL